MAMTSTDHVGATQTAEERSAADKIESTLLDLIIGSVIARYDGEVEDHEWHKNGYTTCLPLDTDHIRDLLTELWSDLAAPWVLDLAFDRLTEDGAESWPHGWHEAEDERELFFEALREDHERELAEEHNAGVALRKQTEAVLDQIHGLVELVDKAECLRCCEPIFGSHERTDAIAVVQRALNACGSALKDTADSMPYFCDSSLDYIKDA
jgi:hypothetical protein